MDHPDGLQEPPRPVVRLLGHRDHAPGALQCTVDGRGDGLARIALPPVLGQELVRDLGLPVPRRRLHGDEAEQRPVGGPDDRVDAGRSGDPLLPDPYDLVDDRTAQVEPDIGVGPQPRDGRHVTRPHRAQQQSLGGEADVGGRG